MGKNPLDWYNGISQELENQLQDKKSRNEYK